MRSLIHLATAAVLALACCGPRSAGAQGHRAPGAPGVLTPQGIPQVLTQMGYQPVREASGYYHVVVRRPTHTIYVRVAVSGDRSVVWLTAKLGRIDTDQVPSRLYRELLRGNRDTARFCLCDCDECKGAMRDFLFAQSYLNRSLTPAVLREELDEFCNSLVRLVDTWEPVLEAQSAVSVRPLPIPNRSLSPKPLFNQLPVFSPKPALTPNTWTAPHRWVTPRSFTSILSGR